MNKKNVFIFAIICIIVFSIFYYIFCISGNNIIRNQKEFVEDVFKKLKSYESDIEVTIISNKNENKYNIKQIVDGENSRLIINSPENVKGLEIENKDGNLRITNNKSNMQKVYENYKSLINNALFIESFIKDFEEFKGQIQENENENACAVGQRQSRSQV